MTSPVSSSSTVVPTGTGSTRSSPLLPVQLAPEPDLPLSARNCRV